MERRDFLKMTAAGAAFAATELSGASRLLSNNCRKIISDDAQSVIADSNYRHLMGLGVSPIGLGCLPMVGYYGGKYDKNDMIALIRGAYDKGVTFFDTAEVYGPYISKEWVGEALQPFRDKVKLATKFGFGVEEGRNTLLNSRPDHIRRAVEGSLRRLRTDQLPQKSMPPQLPTEPGLERSQKVSLTEAKASQRSHCHM